MTSTPIPGRILALSGPVFLNMLLGTDGGQAFAEAQVEAMMSADGLRGIERRMFDSPDDSGALIDISDGGAGWPSGYRPPV